MQKHIPYGYLIVNGKCQIHKEFGNMVCEIFSLYINGMSTNQIAKKLIGKGILNNEQKPSWNHGTIGRILENKKYMGDEFYPQIIDKEIFEQVQEMRKNKAASLGRIEQPNSISNKTIWNDLLICGQCGQHYKKYLEKGKIPLWKCSHYIYKNRVQCSNIFLNEELLEKAFIVTINQAIQKPQKVIRQVERKQDSESYVEKRLTIQIQDILCHDDIDASKLKDLAYKRAAEQYKTSVYNENKIQNTILIEKLYSIPIQKEFNPKLLKEAISKIVVQKEGFLEFHFKNGYKNIVRIKEVELCHQ